MTILLVVGVAVVGLGAFILLLFPDRPGGRIAWQVEVSSIGAGLPLIVVGIVAIALASSGAIGTDGERNGEGGLASDGGRDTQTEERPHSNVPACPRRASSRFRKAPTA